MSALERLLRTLGDEPPDARELADALWLAQQVAASTATGPVGAAGPAFHVGAAGGDAPLTTGPSYDADPFGDADVLDGEAPGGRRAGAGAGLYLPGPDDRVHFGESGGGQWVRLRAPSALRRRGALARSLRPLHRRVASREATVLDEEATVERIVDTALWSPVLSPAPSRWLDLVLIVDDSVSMAVWRDTVREFLSVLVSVGAFRSVQHWALPTEEIATRGIVLRPPGARPGSREDRGPLEIIDPTGRRVVLMASDCISSSWADGTLGSLLRAWGRCGPVALVQLLPRRMWDQSALTVQDVRLRSGAPGAPNTLLTVAPLGAKRGTAGDMAVPVLEMDPRWLGPWAALVSGEASSWDTVATLVPERPVPSAAAPLLQANLSAEEKVRLFVQRCSPAAHRLALHLAAVPLSLPVMRLVQYAVCGENRPSLLTEVLFTGLITRVGDDTPEEPGRPADGAGGDRADMPVLFDFHPGVREILLSGLRRTQILQTLTLVSNWVFERLQRSGEPTVDFSALLRGDDDAVATACSQRPFASVTAAALRHLSAEYEAVARRLEEGERDDGAPTDAGEGPARSVAGVMPAPARLLDRDELLAQLHRDAYGKSSPAQVLVAREGGGATAVAARYVADHGHAYGGVVWLTADRTARPGVLEVPDLVRPAGGGRSDPWLLVVDDARPQDLPERLPKGPGTVLLTSREGVWPPGLTVRPVPPFKRSTSIRLLREGAPGLTAPAALRIAARLDDVPRALDMAAALLAGGRTPETLLTGLGADPAPDVPPAPPLDDPVAAVCGLALEQAVRECPATARVLDLCAVLATGPIPMAFIERVLPDIAQSAASPVVAALRRARLVELSVDETALFLPASVGRTARARMDDARRESVCRLARAAFVAGSGFAAEAGETRAGRDRAALTRHLEAIGALDDRDPAVREAVRGQVRSLAACGDVPGALALGVPALDRLRAQAGAQGPGVAELSVLVSELLRLEEVERAAWDEGQRRP